MRRDLERLHDILEAIDRIQQRTSSGRDAFDDEPLVQVWVIHHLEIVGEACRGLSEELRSRHPEVPWSAIIGMRNILVHDYFGLNLEEVWAAVERDLPTLRRQILAILDAEQGPSRQLAGLRPLGALRSFRRPHVQVSTWPSALTAGWRAETTQVSPGSHHDGSGI